MRPKPYNRATPRAHPRGARPAPRPRPGAHMSLPRPRRLVLVATALALAAPGAVLATGARAASADANVTLPSSPGSNKVTFNGHAPFNNGQTNLLLDDLTGACDPSNNGGQDFRDEHHIQVNVPKKPSSVYDVLIRFQIDWASTTPEFTEDMRMDLFGPDG